MAHKHWFDGFIKSTSHVVSRRGIARTGAGLLPGLLIGAAAGTSAGKQKRGKKNGGGKGSKKGKGKQGNGAGAARPVVPPGPTSGRDFCSSMAPEFPPDDPALQEWLSDCRMFERQCPEDLCVFLPEDVDENTIDFSRSVMCCPPGKQCCTHGCTDPRSDPMFCGKHCRDTTRCSSGLVCIDGECKCLVPDYATGQDCCNGKLCKQGMPCVNGECTCGTYNYCYHRILGQNVCFSGDCSLIA